MKGVISESFWPRQSSLFRTNQKANKYGTTRANMSTVMNEGVRMRYKVVTANLLKVVGLLVEPSTVISKPVSSLKAYISIRQPTISVTSSSPIISPSLSRSLFSAVC